MKPSPKVIASVIVPALIALSALATPASAEGDAGKGEKIFARCKACHTIEVGKNKVGPSLAGVVGRHAGAIADFKYSDAMHSAGVTWDEASLDKYLADPKGFVPGNKMAFPGLKNEQDRQDVIAYLKQAAAQ
jgi:cytochrome c